MTTLSPYFRTLPKDLAFAKSVFGKRRHFWRVGINHQKRSPAVGTYCAVQDFNSFSLSDHSLDVNNLSFSSDKKHSLDLFMTASFAD